MPEMSYRWTVEELAAQLKANADLARANAGGKGIIPQKGDRPVLGESPRVNKYGVAPL